MINVKETGKDVKSSSDSQVKKLHQYLPGQTDAMRNVSQNSQSLNQHLKWGHPEYKRRVPSSKLQCSNGYFMTISKLCK